MKYVKSHDEIMRIISVRNSTVISWRDGYCYIVPGIGNINSDMMTYCGKPAPDKWNFPPVFLEEKE